MLWKSTVCLEAWINDKHFRRKKIKPPKLIGFVGNTELNCREKNACMKKLEDIWLIEF
jgi:hypothetical protein